MAKKTKKSKKQEINKTSKTKQLKGAGKKNKKLTGALICLLLLLVLVSFTFTHTTPDPVSSIRQVVVSLIILVFFGVNLFQNKLILELKHPLVKWFFLLWGGAWLWSILGGVFSLNPAESFLFIGQNFLALIVMFMSILMIQQDRSKFPVIFQTMTLIGLILGLAGLLQSMHIWTNLEDAASFPYGFSFNRTFYGALLGLLIPFAAAVVVTQSGIWRWLGGTALLLEIVVAVMAQSRSAWVAIGVIYIFTLVVVYVFRNRFPKAKLKWWWRLNLSGIALVIVGLFLVVQFNLGGPRVQKIADRMASLVGAGSSFTMAASTKNERLLLWEKSLYVIGDHPLIGVGPGNWKLAAPPYIKEIPSVARGDYFLLRPHNSWLQHGGEYGIPGLLAHMAAWGVLFLMAFRMIKKANGMAETIIYTALTGTALAFAVDMMFSFPHEHLNHLVVLALAFGLIIGLFDQKQEEVKSGIKVRKWGWGIILAVLLATSINAIMSFRYDQVWYKTYQFAGTNDLENTLLWANKGKQYWRNLGPNTDPIEILTSLVYQNHKQYDKALDEIWKAQWIHPNNFRIYNAMGSIYTEMKRYEEAEKVYLQGLELTPKYRQELKNLALNYFQWGKYAACLQVIDQMEILGDEQLTYMQNESQRLLNQ